LGAYAAEGGRATPRVLPIKSGAEYSELVALAWGNFGGTRNILPRRGAVVGVWFF